MPVFRSSDGGLHAFMHVPKCAGTSIEENLERRFGAVALFGTLPGHPVSMQHFTWDDLHKLFPKKLIASSFTVVRHPVSRFFSEYNMRMAQEQSGLPREIAPGDFLDWIEARLPRHADLLDNHLRPQVDFVGPDTRVFRLEDGIEAVLKYLDERFGAIADPQPLGRYDHRPESTRDMFESVPVNDDALIARIGRLYDADFKTFGYELQPEKVPTALTLKPELRSLVRPGMWRGRQVLNRVLSGLKELNSGERL